MKIPFLLAFLLLTSLLLHAQTEDDETIGGRVTYELYVGGNFDFFNALKLQHMGGEFVLKANDIAGGETKRWGFYTGAFSFHNFSFDSSHNKPQQILLKLDNNDYIPGITKYERRTIVARQKVATGQWGYYFNPTFRLNSAYRPLINYYAALHLEVLRTSSHYFFTAESLTSDTTNIVPSATPVFQARYGLAEQRISDNETHGFFGISFPLWLNASDRIQFYFEPTWGKAIYNKVTYQRSTTDLKRIDRTVDRTWTSFYLFRFRATNSFKAFNLTAGGEVRGLLPRYTPNINMYVGLGVNFGQLFTPSEE